MDPTIEAYNKIAEEYEKMNGDSIWGEQIIQFKNLLPDGKIIEIGCGTGRDAAHFVNLNYEYSGIDASERLIEMAQKKVPNGKFKMMNFYQLVFPENTFEGFLAIASLLHIPKDRISKTLNEIIRITKAEAPGLITLRKGVGEGFREKSGTKRYFSFYSQKEFTAVLEKAKMSIVKSGETQEPDGTEWLYYLVKCPKAV